MAVPALLVSLTGLAACSSGADDGGLPTYAPSSVSPSTAASSPSGSTGSTTPGVTGATATASASTGPLEGAKLVTVGIAAPPAKDAAAVFRGYVEFWQADMAALTRSDPTWRPLLERVSGKQRADTVALLTSNQTKKQKITGTITVRPQVLVVRGSVATVRDCVDLSRTTAIDGQGRPVAGTQGSAGTSYSTTMTLQGPIWTVSKISPVTDPTCR